jgi:hypothetical protein
MIYFIKSNISSSMIGIVLIISACIPREEPIEKIVLTPEYALPAQLSENSGMTESDGLIWFINDGGNEAALYGYNHGSNSVERTVIVKDVTNTDWEDISQNGQNIFIGDFGNNAGDRSDLRIYIIDKTSLQGATDTVTVSGIIEFSYADQTDFTPSVENTPFDCEALISTDDSLYLFTKDWQNLQTRIYALSTEPGVQIARFREQWNVSGLITAAAWSSETQELYLLGYTPLYPFIWIYSGFSAADLTYEQSRRTDFTGMWGIQTEGIMISPDGTVRVSAESSAISIAGLYRLDVTN